MASARDVAAAIIEQNPGLDQMQLHKLLYLVQAAHASWFDEPAFDERIEAWKWGPVVRGIAGQYMDFGYRPIDEPVSGDSSAVDERTQWVINRVLKDYRSLSGPDLATVTKAPETPWRQVRGDLPETASSDVEIPVRLMAEYHQLHGVLPAEPSEYEVELAERFFDGDSDALAELFELATGVRPEIS